MKPFSSRHCFPHIWQYHRKRWRPFAFIWFAICFVLPTSVFGFVFVAQRPEFEISAFEYLVILLGLFSLYCYVRELERLGRAFIAREKDLDSTAR